jgi:hypothetical protein
MMRFKSIKSLLLGTPVKIQIFSDVIRFKLFLILSSDHGLKQLRKSLK